MKLISIVFDLFVCRTHPNDLMMFSIKTSAASRLRSSSCKQSPSFKRFYPKDGMAAVYNFNVSGFTCTFLVSHITTSATACLISSSTLCCYWLYCKLLHSEIMKIALPRCINHFQGTDRNCLIYSFVLSIKT